MSFDQSPGGAVPQAGSLADTGALRMVMDGLDDGFTLLGPDFTVLELNREALRIGGHARQDIVGQSLWTAYPEIEHDELGKLYRQAMADRIPVSHEHRIDGQDGQASWIETRAFPVENGCLALLSRDVTERRAKTDRQYQLQQRMKAAIAAIEGVLWTNDADGQMVGEQAGWSKLTGQAFDAYQGYGWADAIHPDDAQATIEAWQTSVAARTTFEVEHRVRRHDGQWRLCAARAVPIIGSGGAVIEWVGIHRDITDAREVELRLHQLAETVDAVFYVHEIDEQRITYVSRAYEDIWGRSRQELYADMRSFMQGVHPDDRSILDDSIAQQLAGKSLPSEYRLRRPDGTERMILDRPFNATDPISGRRLVLGLATDVTEYRRTQELLARNADTFASLIVSNPFGIYVVDADFKLAQVSRGAQTVFAGIDPLIGRDFEDVLRIIWVEPFATEAINIFKQTFVTGEPYVDVSRVEQRGNIQEIEAYDWRVERIVMPDGRFGVVCYFYDLSEREKWSRALEEREAQLQDLTLDLERRVRARTAALNFANERLSAEIERREATQAALRHSQKIEALGQLTSGIAHDFNNILAAVLGGFRVIQNRTKNPSISQIAEMGQKAAQRGAALVQQLLAFAREEDLVLQRVDLVPQISEVRDLIENGIKGEIQLNIQAEPDVWVVETNPAQLQAALLNLAVNANDAMKGRGRLDIAFSNQPAGGAEHPTEMAGRDAVKITITDNGPGMSSQVLQRVTEPFFTTKPAGAGTGLGLAMVQRFVRQSGGALRITSRVGQGTTISLILPRAVGDPTPAKAAEGDAGSDAGSLTGYAFENVLLVEDDDNVSGVLAAGLADAGFTILVSQDAESALAVLQTRVIDIVVTDIDMPGLNGIALVGKVRASWPGMPCIYMTGSARPPALDGEIVLTKPFSLTALQAAMQDALIATEQRSRDVERNDRLALRLKSDCARSLFRHWRAVRTGTEVPLFSQFDASACSEPHRIVAADVDLGQVPIHFDFKQVGDALEIAPPGTVAAISLPVSGSDSLGAREAAYRRCALTGKPSYEYAKSDLNDGQVETFERLLLPFSSNGTEVDRIVGAIVIEQNPSGGDR